MIAGLARSPDDRSQMRLIDVDANHALRPDLLAAAMREDRARGRIPIYICATIGTTSSTAIDPLPQIAQIVADDAKTGNRAWLHVDAAHAGAACICPEHRGLLAGIEHADSLCFNPHKWLLTNFDCDCFWIRDRAALIGALSITPEYLRNARSEAGEVIDFRDWQIPLGRRFRALKLWLVIRHYGAAGLRAHIREHLRLAEYLESLIRADARFDLAAPRTLNLLCFRLRGEHPLGDQLSRELLDRLNQSGRILLTHTMLRDAAGRDRFTLRLCIGSPSTTQGHIESAWQQIQSTAGEIIELHQANIRRANANT
jgi:aromatic-L-amino-acid/L-tryptophan decarboxylase